MNITNKQLAEIVKVANEKLFIHKYEYHGKDTLIIHLNGAQPVTQMRVFKYDRNDFSVGFYNPGKSYPATVMFRNLRIDEIEKAINGFNSFNEEDNME